MTDEPERRPIHIFDIAPDSDGHHKVEVRQVDVVSEPSKKRKKRGAAIVSAEFGPALAKLDELTRDEPPRAG